MVKGVGWATVLINFMMAMFYNTIISWAVYYLVMSFGSIFSELPWKGCGNHWNTNCCIAADLKQYPSNLTRGMPNETTNGSTALSILPENCTRFVYSTEEFF